MSKVNILNLAKREGLFKSFVSPPGQSLVYLDFSSLEPHVLAQLSQDRNLLKLYGKGAKPNDVYIFNGAHMSLYRDKILPLYDPANPTKESITAVKKQYPVERQQLKKFSLSVGYGAQAEKVQSEFALDGHRLSIDEVQSMLDDYWRTYAGVKRLEKHLYEMWQTNGGYIINGRGRPLAIDGQFVRGPKKDLVNRACQSTGHDVLMAYVAILTQLRHDRKLPMKPYICDYHDSTCWAVTDEAVPEVKKAFEDGVSILNDRLDWTVKIAGDVKVGKNLAAFLGD